MRIGALLPCPWPLAAVLAIGTAGAHAAHVCKDPVTGKTTIQQMPCPVVHAPAPPPPPEPTCRLDAKERKAALRRERQFLTSYPDESAHRRAQLAHLKPVVDRIRRTHFRFEELAAQRKPLDKEAEFYAFKPLPAWLKTKLDASDAQFNALVDIFQGAEQDLADIQARYQCERQTFGKLWSGAGPGSSACDRPACASP